MAGSHIRACIHTTRAGGALQAEIHGEAIAALTVMNTSELEGTRCGTKFNHPVCLPCPPSPPINLPICST